jgi:Flp pilus assembly protein protease CpaA
MFWKIMTVLTDYRLNLPKRNMDNLLIIQLMSAVLVLVALSYSSWMDIHTRTAPKWIWSVVFPFALVTTLSWYISAWYWNGFNAILPVFLTSLILSLFCFWMAHRMGNGGDWRALYYVSLLTPWFAPLTLVFACLVGFVQVGVDWYRKSPIKSAWMVSITIGFVLSVVAKVFIL